MKNLQFPIQFKFNIGTLSNDFTATDRHGSIIGYTRQKMFKLKEDIEVFSDEGKTNVNYKIKADRWLDWSAAYAFEDANGQYIGKIARKGWASLWKAQYEIIDQNENQQYHIREEKGWVKVIDSLLGEIPIVNFFTGYLFNPSYIVLDNRGKEIARLSKEPSFWGRKFTIDQLSKFDNDDDDRILLSLMMMILLERRRG